MRGKHWSLAEVSLVIVLLGALSGVTASAAPVPSVSLGVVSSAVHAHRGTTAIENGAAIFDGDNLSTDASGTLQAQLGQSQVNLLPNSNILVHRLFAGYSASLASGTIVFSSEGGETVQVVANGATIQPKDATPTIAQISYINANELILTSKRGDLLVTMGNQSQTVTEGSSYRMMIRPGGAPGPQGAFSSGTDYFYLVLILLAAGGIAYAIDAALSSSSAP